MRCEAEFALARYTPDGSLDLSFGTGDKGLTDFGGEARANAVAVQPDGQVVVAGCAGDYPKAVFALARYQGR